jgi:hypothetical protein
VKAQIRSLVEEAVIDEMRLTGGGSTSALKAQQERTVTSTWLAPRVEDLQVRKGANKWNGKRLCATDRRNASGRSS